MVIKKRQLVVGVKRGEECYDLYDNVWLLGTVI